MIPLNGLGLGNGTGRPCVDQTGAGLVMRLLPTKAVCASDGSACDGLRGGRWWSAGDHETKKMELEQPVYPGLGSGQNFPTVSAENLPAVSQGRHTGR